MISNEEGIQAIIYLQNMAGIKETRKSAIKIWDSFNKHEKEFTKHFYKVMKARTN